jgi:ABC-2 type transport system ATP-binding protein
VAIIQQGVLKTVGTVGSVMNVSGSAGTARTEVEVSASDNGSLKNLLMTMHGIEHIMVSENELLLTCLETVTAEEVNQFCFDHGMVLNKLNIKRKSLETRFLYITGNQSDR